MANAMDEAGLLNSMTVEQLKITCSRLQRSTQDVQMLLHEYQAEQVLLRREHDRLHQRIEKVMAQAEQKDKHTENHGIIWSVMSEVDKKLEVSQLFKAKEERKAAKRRRWNRGASMNDAAAWRPPGGGPLGQAGAASAVSSAALQAARGQDAGPFGEACLQMSLASDVSSGKLRPNPLKGLQDELERWVREVVCGDPVAEAEPLTESQQVWGAQFGGVAQTPELRGRSGRLEPLRATEPRSGDARASPRQRTPETAPGGQPGRSPPPSTAWRTNSRPDPSNSPGGDSALEFAEGAWNSLTKDATPNMLGRRISNLAEAAADWAASNLLPAESGTSRRDESPAPRGVHAAVSVTVVLKRSGDDRRWGLAWETAGFKRGGERVVEHLQPGSVAESWNKMQDQSGHPERRIQAGDRLISANGKTQPDEIKAELAGREVVLEFRRWVVRRSPSPRAERGGAAGGHAWHPGSSSMSPRGAAAPGQLAPAPQAPTPQPAPPKRAFQDAFADYLKAVAPEAVAEHSQPGGRQLDTDQSPSRAPAQWRVIVTPPTSPVRYPGSVEAAVHSLRRAAQEAAHDETMGGDASPANGLAATLDSLPQEDAPIDVPVREAPYGLVVQVLSLASGSLRLSWLFDWAAAPVELAGEAWAARRYEVVRRHEENGEEVRHPPSSQSSLALDLPVGHRYRFQVRALLVDSRADDGAEDTSLLWASTFSAAEVADLRAPARPAEPRPSPVDGGSAVAPPPRRRGVASSLGSFLASAAAAPGAGASPTAAGTAPLAPMSPMSSTVEAPPPAGEVEGAMESPPRPLSESASLVMGPFPDPATASRGPRSPVAFAFDTAGGKRDAAEVLRMRRSGGVHGVLDPHAHSIRQRSGSFDSDDEGSLMRLAGALGALERQTAAAKQSHEVVAQEGHHSLQDRLDGGAVPPPVRASPGHSPSASPSSSVPSAAAAAAALAARGGQAPVARPTEDSADDAGWAHLGEEDRASAASP